LKSTCAVQENSRRHIRVETTLLLDLVYRLLCFPMEQEFRKFADSYEFEHQTSSPRYPQREIWEYSKNSKETDAKSHGSRLRSVSRVIGMKKLPLEQLSQSPVQLVIGRRKRTPLPTDEALSSTPATQAAKSALTAAKRKQARRNKASANVAPRPRTINRSSWERTRPSWHHRPYTKRRACHPNSPWHRHIQRSRAPDRRRPTTTTTTNSSAAEYSEMRYCCWQSGWY